MMGKRIGHQVWLADPAQSRPDFAIYEITTPDVPHFWRGFSVILRSTHGLSLRPPRSVATATLSMVANG